MHIMVLGELLSEEWIIEERKLVKLAQTPWNHKSLYTRKWALLSLRV